ncbi:hypothetical protein G6F24_016258 [Rhizopus arrhizus]|nr:hypothetical protein G6F24_016258 [Rhizopus arrhizus]
MLPYIESVTRYHAEIVVAACQPLCLSPDAIGRVRDGGPGHAGHRLRHRPLGRNAHASGQGRGPHDRDVAPVEPVQFGAEGCRDRAERLSADRRRDLPAAVPALAGADRSAPCAATSKASRGKS